MQYRADQVGSLLRPPELVEAHSAYRAGKLPLDALRELENQAILEILEQQRQSGIDVLTDGEYRRYNYYSNLVDAVEGFVTTDEVLMVWKGGEAAHSPSRAVGARLQQRQRLTEHEVDFLKAHALGPIKVTVTTPNQYLTMYRPGLTEPFYPTREDLAQELVGVVRREIEWLIGQGVRYVQIDAPGYTALVDAEGRERLQQRGVDPDAALQEAIALDNACVEGLAREG